MQYRYFPYSLHHCAHNIASSDSVPVTCLTVGITVPTTALWFITGYLPHSWHHCTYNSTSSDAIPLLPLQLASLYPHHHYIWCSTVTSLLVGITVPTTSLHLMQYRYFPYSWHHCTHNITKSDAVPVTSRTVDIIVPTTPLTVMQYVYFPYS